MAIWTVGSVHAKRDQRFGQGLGLTLYAYMRSKIAWQSKTQKNSKKCQF
jgi:hypothetical protein